MCTMYAHKPSWMSPKEAPFISRPLQVHQVKKEWSETQATSTHRLSGEKWSQPWLALDGTDADPNGLLSEPVTIYTESSAGFVEFDITEAMRNWQNEEPNYGVLLTNILSGGTLGSLAMAGKIQSSTHMSMYSVTTSWSQACCLTVAGIMLDFSTDIISS